MRYKVIQEDVLNAYILDTEKNEVVTLCYTKRPDLGFEKLKELVNDANKSEIYRKYWIELCNQIAAELDKDDWCRLNISREKVAQMKEMLENV